MYLLKTLFIPIALLGLLAVFTYGALTGSFYEQEEWLGLGNTFVYGSNYLLGVLSNPLKMLLGDGRILSGLITYFFYTNFPFNTLPISIFQIVVHAINTFLVYLLLRKTIEKTIPSLLGASFFAVNAVSQSAVSWSAAVSTLPATTLILLALHILIRSTSNLTKVINKKNLSIAIILVYVSLLFKQIGIFMFILLPIAGIYISAFKRKPIWQVLIPKLTIPLVIFSVVVFAWLFYFKNISGPSALFLTGSNQNFFQTLTLRALLYPLTSFSLIFVPPEHFLNFSRHITNLYYPFFPPEQFILIAQTVVLDLLAVILSFALLVLLVVLSRRNNESNKVMWFFVMFLLTTFLPYTLIGKSYSYLDSRYYYLAGIGASFVLAWIITVLWSKSKKLGWILAMFVCLLVLVHGTTAKHEVEKQIQVASERKELLSQISRQLPALKENKNIFYITGSSDFYLPGHKVPFQNGFGHTLAVWYFHTGKIPQKVIKDRKLFEIGSQGYHEYGGLGFGYFSDINSLKATIANYQIPISAVVALYYNEKDKILTNTTQETRKKLQ